MFVSMNVGRQTTRWVAVAMAALLIAQVGCDKAKEALEKTKEKASELAKSAKEQMDKTQINPIDRKVGDDGVAIPEGVEGPATPVDPAAVAKNLIGMFAIVQDQGQKNEQKLKELAALAEPFRLQVVSLELRGSPMTNAGLTEIAKFPNLKYLNIATCPGISGAGFATISQCQQLETLEADTSGFDDAAFAAIKSNVALKTLNISQCNVTDAGFANILPLTAIEKLTLEGCKGITGISVAKGPFCPNLIEFRAKNSMFGSKGTPALKSAGKIQIVDLAGSGLDDKTAPQLSTLATLRELSIGSNSVTVKGAGGLSALKNLEILWIPGTQLTGKDLKFLLTMKSLKQLHMEGLYVTPDQKAALEKALSETNIVFQ